MKRFAAKGLRSNAQIIERFYEFVNEPTLELSKTRCVRITVDEERRYYRILGCTNTGRVATYIFSLIPISLFDPIICDVFRRAFVAVNLVI